MPLFFTHKGSKSNFWRMKCSWCILLIIHIYYKTKVIDLTTEVTIQHIQQYMTVILDWFLTHSNSYSYKRLNLASRAAKFCMKPKSHANSGIIIFPGWIIEKCSVISPGFRMHSRRKHAFYSVFLYNKLYASTAYWRTLVLLETRSRSWWCVSLLPHIYVL